MEERVNIKLKKYIEKEVFPQYELNEKGHGIEHILDVITREFEIIKENSLELNYDIAYIVGAYHDIGHHIDAKHHEVESAKIFMQDEAMKNFCDEEERKIIREAIEDHRASLKYEPRSIFGKLISSADRNTDYIQPLIRTYNYKKRLSPEIEDEKLIEDSYQHIQEKFGEGGYAKMYFKDSKYVEFLAKTQELLKNRVEFERLFRELNHMSKVK